MSFASALRAHLAADATIAALVGERIQPLVRPEGNTVPALTYEELDIDQASSLAGRADSLRNIRVRLNCWARRHADMLSLESAVRSRMNTAADSFRATLTPSGGDQYDPDTKLYARALDYSCWYSET